MLAAERRAGLGGAAEEAGAASRGQSRGLQTQLPPAAAVLKLQRCCPLVDGREGSTEGDPDLTFGCFRVSAVRFPFGASEKSAVLKHNHFLEKLVCG